jgi:DNA-binding SARP family transcriptional activator/tetratricopeptide (TPR) repeat protein
MPRRSREGDGNVHVQLLGDVQISVDGRGLELGGHRQLCILAVLLLEPGQVVPTERIVARAWPAGPPETAADLVTSYVSRLRRALKDVAGQIELVNRRPGYLVQVAPDAVDVHRFTRLVRQARSERDALDFERAALLLHEALDLWHGTALANVASPWLDDHRFRLEQQRLDAVEDLADLELRNGRADRVAAQLRALSRAQPDRERLAVLTIRALEAVGEPNQAADLASHVIRLLRRRGLNPSPELRQAQQDALRSNARPAHSGSARMQLPADTPAFTGRTQEVTDLVSFADEGRVNETVAVGCIEGMPGIGKTALAIHAAHLLAGRFPDGQLFIDLHGFTPETAPVKPEIALDRLLRALGVPPQQIPIEADARAAAYRERLAGTKTLIVLDNAASEAQVRPLLPGAPGCLVLITSRRRLSGLDDAHILWLGALLDADATTLFTTVAGVGRISGGDPALAETINLCAKVPLTLRIAAARLRNRPSWPLRHLVERLRDQSQRLAQLNDGDRSLAAAVNVSYDQLTREEQRLFRYLGLHPGIDIDLFAAAALIDSTASTSELLLEGLVDHNLLSQPSTGRYEMHDLIRLHALDHASAEAPDEQRAALERLLNYYLHTAHRADRLLSRQSAHHVAVATPAPAESPVLATDAHAIAWMEAERINLTAMIDHCDQLGLPAYIAPIAAAMHTALHTQGHWTLAERLQQAALESASRRGDGHGQATALRLSGDVALLMGRYADAIETAGRAVDLYRRLHDRTGEANACCTLAEALRLTSRFSQATDALERAMHLYSGLGDWLGEAAARTSLGGIQKLAGKYAEAEANLETAHRLCTEFGHRYGQAAALTDLGVVQQMTGQHGRALKALQEALELYRDLGNRLGEASTLTYLGELRRVMKQYAEAERLLRTALDLHRDLRNRLGQAETLTSLGAIQNARGSLEESRATLEQACLLYREIGNQLGLSAALFALAHTLGDLGRHQEALAHREQASNVLTHIEQDL